MSDSRAVHRRERASSGQMHVWVIEKKEGGIWVRVRVHRGKDGPKASKGQRVRRLKGKEARYGRPAEPAMSEAEIKHTLGW